MFDTVKRELQAELQKIRDDGLYKDERVLASPQGPVVTLADGREVLVFCANNYLGLSSHPDVIAAAHRALDARGYGLSSVRFICGTQDLHKTLERKIADFVGTEDTILYAACFDANGGVFEPLLAENDAVISDALNHASIIDGVRLCKAQRWRYEHNDMKDLERCLDEAVKQGTRRRLIATDGVFSMDGTVANLRSICDLADRYQAMVMVDDCHATGFVGPNGRGSADHAGVTGRVDIVTGTLGKSLGGALGGWTSGRREIVELLRQRSRPYLFSNSLPPAVVGALDRGVRPAVEHARAARPARGQHAAFPEPDDRRRVRAQGRHASNRPDHALRRAAGARDGAPPARSGCLRHRLFPSGGAQGPGAHSRPALGRPPRGAHRPRGRRVHTCRAGARSVENRRALNPASPIHPTEAAAERRATPPAGLQRVVAKPR